MFLALCQTRGHEHGSGITPSSSSSQSIVRHSNATSPDGKRRQESLYRTAWRHRQGHNSGLEVREAFRTGMTLSRAGNVFRWRRRRESSFDIRNKWAKAQIMKAHGVSGKGKRQSFWNMVPGAVLGWPVLTESPSLNYEFLGVKPGTVHYPLLNFQHLAQCPEPCQNSAKFFQVSEWVQRRVHVC